MKNKNRSVLNLKKGETAYVRTLINNRCSCQLMALGLLPKAKVKLIRKSLLGKSLYIQINDHYIAVRKSEAANILID